APPEVLEQPSTGDGADRSPGAREPGPNGDGSGPLMRGEDVGEDGEGRGHDQSCAHAHDGAQTDQGTRAVDEGGDAGGGGEDDEADLERAFPAKTVSQGAGGEQQ